MNSKFKNASAPAFNRANDLRLRLRGGLLPIHWESILKIRMLHTYYGNPNRDPKSSGRIHDARAGASGAAT